MNIDKTTVQEQRVRDAIFSYEPREGIELEPGYVPGYLKEASTDPRIRVRTMSEEVDKVNAKSISTPLQGEFHFSLPVVSDEIAAPPAFTVAECEDILDNVVTGEVETTQAVMQPMIYQQNAFVTINSSSPAMIQDVVDDVKGSVCNYLVTPLLKLVYINRFGKAVSNKERFICSIRIAGLGEDTFEIRTCEIKSITTIIGRRFSAASVNYNITRAEKIIENRFRNLTTSVPIQYIYIDYGWQKIGRDMLYAHDCLPPMVNGKFETGMMLPFLDFSREKVAEIFYDAWSLYSDVGPISVMLSFSVMGVLYRLFDEAGYAPRFLLFVHGKTGSMKTALTKILYTQLTDEEHRKTLRRIDLDTVASFERGLVERGRDTISAFDDYSPAKSARQKRGLEAKLESLIRMAGDGATRSRSNVLLEDRRGEGVQGMVMLTGELTGKGLSSNLRCFYCGIQREKVNEQAASLFQENEYLFTTFIDQFAKYVSVNWDGIIGLIRNNFQGQREMAASALKERRLIDSAATLCLASQLIRNFLTDWRGQDAGTVAQHFGCMESAIREMAAISEAVSSEDTPIVQIMTSIDRLIQGQQLILHHGRPDEQQVEAVDGFTEGDYIYFHPDRLYAKVKSAFTTADIYLPLDMNELARALCEEGVAKASSNGASKKTYYARILIGRNTRKMSFVKLNIVLLRKAIDN